ncbi:ATP-binding cassette domain-containing protein [Pseudomonas sp. PA-6-1D]|nr:ATP-binding cassette domain-containing protein [Pseudomonas sp. PA-6-3C]MCF5145917.1 ATP-binding cassette domain-containing protein [Pseudomonas sp. PA-6-3F]MCF5161892.1 ATP-binding cassette domain-containing protein [Pseudomonas sp. PA-6-2E]MCF5175166.1 ATP-binding cassette domain-containing protein [Pseudomonas sp. PA-6-1D]MCF5191450.1 ATP-binding cassette domain-containing protein [Pseudomonas sp. PA-6-1H]
MAIKVSGVSKCFHIYDNPRDRFLQMFNGRRKQYFREFWALRDVSFAVRKGETVGIIGRNGSGKSTLLQIICGTLTPTSGDVQTSGRVAALLELGSGFNPDFSGRENVYMNAAVLGLSREETDARFSEIEAFAEIGNFIDQPVKTYSSGMMVRLAFAVAINVDPQILIVDEALSVGDELFQRKCFARIEAIKANGATILFVSHSGSAIVELCDRAILLDNGDKLTEGTPKSVIGKYQKLLYAPSEKIESIRAAVSSEGDVALLTLNSMSEPAQSSASKSHVDEVEEFYDPHLISKSEFAYESHGAVIHLPRIVDLAGEPVNCLKRGRTYRYTYKVEFAVAATGVRFGMMIKTLAGVELGGAATALNPQDAISYVSAGTVIQVEFAFECNLNPGTYFVNAGVLGAIKEGETYLHRLLDACLFRVLPVTEQLATGVIDFKCVPDVLISSGESIRHSNK